MKAVGAGGALSVLGGSVAASQHEENDTAGDEGDTDVENPVENTVHTVRTLIGQSTNPNRPADFFYEPTGLHVNPGDIVRFVSVTPDHTVTSYHPVYGMQRRIPRDAKPFSSPILGWDPNSLPDDMDEPPAEHGASEDPGEDSETDGPTDEAAGPTPDTWLRAFDEPGVYDLECAPHEAFGMAMRIVVGDETETTFETSNPENLPEPRAGPVGFARLVLTDANLEPEHIVESSRVEWTDLEINQTDGSQPTESDE